MAGVTTCANTGDIVEVVSFVGGGLIMKIFVKWQSCVKLKLTAKFVIFCLGMMFLFVCYRGALDKNSLRAEATTTYCVKKEKYQTRDLKDMIYLEKR